MKLTLELPEIEAEGIFEDEPVSLDDYWRVSRRFNSLPFQYFFTVPQPVTETPEERLAPVVGDICDDLADIYRALKEGLHIYDKGQIKNAVFYWREGFCCYWGRYATSALHALHCYETKNES